jgi:hypothetical protein
MLFTCAFISVTSLIIRSMYVALVVDRGLLELNAVPQLDAVFGRGLFVCLPQSDVALLLLGPGRDGTEICRNILYKFDK